MNDGFGGLLSHKIAAIAVLVGLSAARGMNEDALVAEELLRRALRKSAREEYTSAECCLRRAIQMWVGLETVRDFS